MGKATKKPTALTVPKSLVALLRGEPTLDSAPLDFWNPVSVWRPPPIGLHGTVTTVEYKGYLKDSHTLRNNNINSNFCSGETKIN